MSDRAFRLLFFISVSIIAFVLSASYADTVLLVNFGARAQDNVFGIPTWNVAFAGSHTAYTDAGPDGTTMTSGSSIYYDYQGVTGTTPMELRYGHQIVVTWYNNSGAEINIMPLVSFEDANNPNEAFGEPQWYGMTEMAIPAWETSQTTYDIYDGSTNSGLGISEGTYSLVNVCIRSIDFQNIAICDKIELNDNVDIVPPSQPQSLQASTESDTAIALSWTASTDNVEVTEYRIFRDDIHVGKSSTTAFIDYGLQPNAQHTYTVAAIDEKRNESEYSASATAATARFLGGESLINPLTDMSYLGAFKLPNSDDTPYTWEYGGFGMTYYPNGDPANVHGDAEFPGSIYAFGHMWGPYISEISIPPPVISPTKNINDLNTAANLQDFYDIKPYPEDFLLPMADAEYLPKQESQTTGKLYIILGDNYAWEKIPTHAACELDLSNPQTVGKWYVGSSLPYSEPFHFAYIGFLFEIPQDWADANTPGHRLISGGYREGGLVGLGPALFAIGPWSDSVDGTLPSPNTELSYKRLLQYGEDHTSINYINGYSYGDELYVCADNWSGGAFLTADGKSAVMLVGTRCLGECWYGWPDGIRSTYDIPVIYGSVGSKGYQAASTTAQFVFYNPDDLAAVADGVMESHEPQPYAVLNIDEFLFCENPDINRNPRIASASFDRQRGILYVFEPHAYGEGSPIVHVWVIESAPPPELEPGTVIIEALSPVDIAVTDPTGQTINRDESEIQFATYIEVDSSGDGEPDDIITIPDAILGEYSITAIPEAGAEPTDTYILRASYGDEVIILAANTMIQEIPPFPYTFFFPQRKLELGWNLISIPVLLTDNALDVALQSIEGQYESIWMYDSTESEWKRYIVNGPAFLNNLDAIDPGKSYWIEATEATFLTLDGDIVDDEAILLNPGWNLVGYNCLTAKERAAALVSIDGNYDSAWTYIASEEDWKRHIPVGPEFLNDLDTMFTGDGYWIDALITCSWDVNAAPPAASPAAFAKNHAPAEKPEIPYTIWGSIEVNGIRMTAENDSTVSIKTDGIVRNSYRLGSIKQYGNHYALDIPVSGDVTQADIYVQIDSAEIKAATVPIDRPGRTFQVDLNVKATPKANLLHQNYPNPFNPDTWIPYQLQEDANVVIRIYSVTGQLIRTLDIGHKSAGFYTGKEKSAPWDGKDENGEFASSGIYFIQLKADNFSATRKMTMIR